MLKLYVGEYVCLIEALFKTVKVKSNKLHQIFSLKFSVMNMQINLMDVITINISIHLRKINSLAK